MAHLFDDKIPLLTRFLDLEADIYATIGKPSNVTQAFCNTGFEYSLNYKYLRITQETTTALLDDLELLGKFTKAPEVAELRTADYIEFKKLSKALDLQFTNYEGYNMLVQTERLRRDRVRSKADTNALKEKKKKKHARGRDVSSMGTHAVVGTFHVTNEQFHDGRVAKQLGKREAKIQARGTNEERAVRLRVLEEAMPGTPMKDFMRNISKYLCGKKKCDVAWAKEKIEAARKKKAAKAAKLASA